MFDVVGVGANSTDFVYRLPEYPAAYGPLSKLRISSHERSPGGQTATALSACAALGLRTSYIGTVSNDGNGDFIREALETRGIDLSRVIVRSAGNPFAVILVAEGLTSHGLQRGSGQGERIVLWDRPPEMALKPADLPAGFASSARLVHVDDVDPDAAIAAGKAGIAARVHVTSDIEAARPKTPAILDAVTIPIFAEHVPGDLTGERDLERGLRILRQRHAGMLVVTLGARGAAMLDGGRFIRQPAFPVDVIDTTGAGDVFRAGFIYALLRGDTPEGILRFACAAAAVSCTRRGAIVSVPTLDEVNALMA
ncbi:MAG TPA: carbohydrate kinase family protein [Vicinamibacterales bacterium]|nr:carbohydrate kinase family protein [Vicinamibacterales bacterium]